MGEWKALRKASGTGWKELERESGTGWKALEWEYEDFTTFTEVDIAADRIQKTANHIDHLSYRNEIAVYLYKDYGVDHFTDFTHKIKTRCDFNCSSCQVPVYMLSNYINDAANQHANSRNFFYAWFYGGSYLGIREDYGGSAYDSSWSSAAANTWYYIKIVKSGTSLTAYIYSDSGYSTLLHTCSLTLHTSEAKRYLYAASNYYLDATSAYVNIDTENFDLG